MDKVAQREELIRRLVSEYCQKHPRSEKHYQSSCSHLIRGGSHTLRLFQPFPFYDARCQGSRVIDLDGHSYIDFWQGHYANILGHNPKLITAVLVDRFRKGEGLHTGFPSTLQRDFASLLLGQIKGEKVRFTTSGALTTIFAVMLARAYTGRNMILKVAGGWHGT
ncbi:glutamate-1-semialdehyde 2,1-aminomutase, partial [bacterium (candidate division B38) B3_B38]